MQTHAPTAEQDRWLREVLGVDPEPAGPTRKPITATTPDPASNLSQAARDPEVWTRSVGTAMTRQGPYKTGARIQAPTAATGPAQLCRGPAGQTVAVGPAAGGRIAVTREPPPITSVTFSGGGGKGAALPGAIRALKSSGVLDQAKRIHGASVGSMTAAMLAAGAAPEDFQRLSDETDWDATIMGGEKVKYHVAGNALEDLVRNAMRSALGKQVSAYAQKVQKSGKPLDDATTATLERVNQHLAKAGPTFMDLRLLSKIIPDVKEVVISGTMIGKAGNDPAKPDAGKLYKTKPESIVFSADTFPDLEVARAVHASAALPPIFMPVDIPLPSGGTGRFEDGGVLNNAPTPESTGMDPDLDPTPETGSMTFVFEDKDSRQILKGAATPSRSRLGDAVSGAEFSAATFAKNRGLADRKEDVVMVPLKFMTTSGKNKDYSGDFSGTANFNIPKEDRTSLQTLSEQATKTHLEKRRQPETRTYATQEQMLACVTRDELAAMAQSGYPGAKDALAFRDGVDAQTAALQALAAKGAGANDDKVRAILVDMDNATGGDQERVGYVGRALNRGGKLAGLLAGAKGVKAPDLDSLAAGLAVAAVLAARKAARDILRETIYPKMVREGPNGVMGALLAQMDTMLRDARSSADINKPLRIGIAFFSDRFDPGGKLGHKKFAQALTRHIQPDD